MKSIKEEIISVNEQSSKTADNFRKDVDANLLKIVDQDYEAIFSKIKSFDTHFAVENMNKYAGLLWNTKYWKVFQRQFLYTYGEIVRFLLNSKDNDLNTNLLLKFIVEISDRASETVSYFCSDVFIDFFPKWFNYKKVIKDFSHEDYFDTKFYNFEELNDNEKLIKNIYLMAIIYQFSYLVWLNKIDEIFKTRQGEIDFVWLQPFVKNTLWDKIEWGSSLEKRYLYSLFYLLSLYFDKKDLPKLAEHFTAGRIKTIYSSIFKILKSDKYLRQYDKELILADQIWFLFRFDESDKNIVPIIEKIQQEWLEWKTKKWFLINKFNDRGVLTRNFDNTDTMENIIPFVNVWITIFNDNFQISLWELSFRTTPDKRLSEILSDYKEHKNRVRLLEDLVRGIDELNHEIYKVSQEIKTSRKLFVDEKVLPKKRNISVSAENFLNRKIKYLIKDLTNRLSDYSNEKFTNKEKEYIVVKILWEKIEKVIHDLAWEKVVDKIKEESDTYNSKKDIEKKEYLKKLSEKYMKWVNKKKKYKDKYFILYKQEYKKVLSTAIFYQYFAGKLAVLEKQVNL